MTVAPGPSMPSVSPRSPASRSRQSTQRQHRSQLRRHLRRRRFRRRPPSSAEASRAIEIGTSPGGVDRGTWTRFRGGKLAPQRTLDLHGRTVQRAHAELHAFFGAAMAERLRCVEIITGRGSGETGGVLRREVPLWLNSPALRPIILAASHPHPANQGAIRVLLRRIR